jgi:hypothetical protein
MNTSTQSLTGTTRIEARDTLDTPDPEAIPVAETTKGDCQEQ